MSLVSCLVSVSAPVTPQTQIGVRSGYRSPSQPETHIPVTHSTCTLYTHTHNIFTAHLHNDFGYIIHKPLIKPSRKDIAYFYYQDQKLMEGRFLKSLFVGGCWWMVVGVNEANTCPSDPGGGSYCHQTSPHILDPEWRAIMAPPLPVAIVGMLQLVVGDLDYHCLIQTRKWLCGFVV